MENMSLAHIDCSLKLTGSVYRSPDGLVFSQWRVEITRRLSSLSPNHLPVCLPAASGNRRAQCLPCCGGHLPGVFCMGSSHHPHAHGKPGYMQAPPPLPVVCSHASVPCPIEQAIEFLIKREAESVAPLWLYVCRCVFSASNGQRNMKRASNRCIVSKHSLLKGLSGGARLCCIVRLQYRWRPAVRLVHIHSSTQLYSEDSQNITNRLHCPLLCCFLCR